MSKKALGDRHKPKKQLDEEAIAHFKSDLPGNQQNSTRKRLKKFAQINPQEEIVHGDSTEKLPEDQHLELQDYGQFALKDDEELKQQKEQAEASIKHSKGNRKLDQFLQKKKPEQPSKPAKSKQQKVQLTLEQIALIKKQKKQRRKDSDDFIISDHADISSEEAPPHASHRLEQYKEINGSMDDENKLIEKAIKLSLATTPEKQDFSYPIADEEVNRPLHLSKKHDNKDIKPKQLKQSKVKEKPKPKESKNGPLAGFVIAFTGEFQDYQKDQVIEVCMQLGADCPKSLTRKCNLLIQGSFVMDHFKRKLSTPVSETAKSKEAKEKNIAIIPSTELEDFFISKTGTSLQEHIDKNKIPPSNFAFMTRQDHPPPQKVEQKNLNSYFQEEPPKSSNISDIERQKITNVYPKEEEIKPANFINNSPLNNRLWTDKYKPATLNDVIGENSQIKTLKEWLSNWHNIHIRGLDVESPDSKNNMGAKAALISGDPGIGKTTSARLLAMELNYAVTQFNASDVRNKSGIALMQCGSYNLDQAKNLQKPLVIMDEVDGMSSGDRGGIAAIIQLIKTTKVPIICICNDRSNQKIRSLANHCLDIRFHKPQKLALARRLKEILKQEGGSGEDRALEMLVETFQNDMRQILTYLQLIFKTVSKNITISALSDRQRHSKDMSVMINHFDAVRRLLNRSQFNGLRVSERNECFFVDSDLVPIMVHQNILASNRKNKMTREQFRGFVQGLEGFVIGDMLDKTIRKEQEWGLMPSYGFMTCVYSSEKISDSVGFPQFPSWLGKFSSERKNRRLTRQFKNMIFPLSLCSNMRAVKNQFSPVILQEIVSSLKKEDVEEAMEFMELYNLSPASINEHLPSIVMTPDKTNPFGLIPSQTKAKLTRLFNKRHEDAKLKQLKSKKSVVEHLKFNPVLQQLQVEDEPQPEPEEGEEVKKVQPKKGKKK